MPKARKHLPLPPEALPWGERQRIRRLRGQGKSRTEIRLLTGHSMATIRRYTQ